MKNVSCVRRVYKVKDNGNVYYVTAKKELSENLTVKLLQEDTFLDYDITTGINDNFKGIITEPERPESMVITEPESSGIKNEDEKDTVRTNKRKGLVNKAMIFINNRHMKGRDFSSVELAEYLKRGHKSGTGVITKLRKSGIVVRSNPEVTEKRKYRWKKVENVNVNTNVDKIVNKKEEVEVMN